MLHKFSLGKFYIDISKLPKFIADNCKPEVFKYIEDTIKVVNKMPAEIPMFPILSVYLINELPNCQMIYERLYTNSLPILKKKYLLFTHLFRIANFSNLEENGTPGIEGELEPYYQVKDFKDETLIFESRFESGNLALALKVNTIITIEK